MATCSGCDSTWTGLKICHCAGCHISYSVEKWFVKHQVRGKCLPPSAVKLPGPDPGTFIPALKLNAFNVWVGAVANPRFTKEEDEDA